MNAGKIVTISGLTMLVAAAFRALADLLQQQSFDLWSGILVVGCLLLGIGAWIAKRAAKA